MKIYSEKTNQEYQSVEECLNAEAEYDKALAEQKAKEEQLTATRKARATEVEKAYKAILDAQKNYNEKLNAFIKDYGSFHMTLKSGDFNPFNGFEQLFKGFWL